MFQNAIQDNWIENIDWVTVKERSRNAPLPAASDSDSDDEPATRVDPTAVYRDMLTLLRPGESVVQALRRFGGVAAGGTRQRWKSKRAKTDDGPPADKAGVLRLTELANGLVQSGDLDVYQYTHEKLAFLVKKAETAAAAAAAPPVIPEGTDDDDAMDMFARDLDKDKSEEHGETNTNNKGAAEESSAGEREATSRSVTLYSILAVCRGVILHSSQFSDGNDGNNDINERWLVHQSVEPLET